MDCEGPLGPRALTPVALPTHQLIDEVIPDNPVAVTRTDGHMMPANTVAMRLEGIDQKTKDVPGGVKVDLSELSGTLIYQRGATQTKH